MVKTQEYIQWAQDAQHRLSQDVLEAQEFSRQGLSAALLKKMEPLTSDSTWSHKKSGESIKKGTKLLYAIQYNFWKNLLVIACCLQL